MNYAAMGARIRRRRREIGLTQEQLAEAAEVSPSFLGHIERGTRTASIDTLVRLCLALNMSADAVLGMPYLQYEKELPQCVTVNPCDLLRQMAEVLKKHENPC